MFKIQITVKETHGYEIAKKKFIQLVLLFKFCRAAFKFYFKEYVIVHKNFSIFVQLHLKYLFCYLYAK